VLLLWRPALFCGNRRVQPLGGNGSRAGGIVSLLRIFPSSPFTFNSPPPDVLSCWRAEFAASRCVLCNDEARSAPSRLLAHVPSGRCDTVLSDFPTGSLRLKEEHVIPSRYAFTISTRHAWPRNWHQQSPQSSPRRPRRRQWHSEESSGYFPSSSSGCDGMAESFVR
jgi:hypothetical protein